MVFWHIDMRIDCYGPYCIPVPKAILAIGKNLSKWWLGTTVEGIIETQVVQSSTVSVFFTVGLRGHEDMCVTFEILPCNKKNLQITMCHIASWNSCIGHVCSKDATLLFPSPGVEWFWPCTHTNPAAWDWILAHITLSHPSSTFDHSALISILPSNRI